MMKQVNNKLTLDRAAIYQIKVPGHLNNSWSDWFSGMTDEACIYKDGMPVTILTGAFDQAALQGLLRRLYSLGLPLISVVCVDIDG